ncbi:MAG: DUF349 domain-containing protein [Cyclobacteriaceae bacterium]|nr:DUF349 domain-containing protein [Cyclobacteriaceae bacterium]
MKEHPFVKISGDKIIRKGFLDIPDREIGEVRENPESSIQYFENRFPIIEQKVESLEKNIDENENKGSFLMKLIHLKEYIARFDGIGDFEKLYQRLEDKEKYLLEIIHKNRIRNYEIKKAFLDELGMLKDHYNLKEAGERIREIRQEWIKTGAVLEEHREEIETRFNEYLDFFNARKESYIQDRILAMEDTIKHYQEIVKKAERLYHFSDFRESTRRLKELQLEWKNLGRIPPDPYNQLKEKFQKINDEIFRRFRESRDEQLQHRQKNVQYIINQKTRMLNEIWDKIEQNSKDLYYVKKDYLDRWKKLGNLFNKEIQILNDKFYSRILFINEILFVEMLARKKYSNFEQLSPEDKNRIQINILGELIERDEKDLNMYNQNMEVFNFRRGGDNKVFRHKRNDKQKALVVKRELLRSLKRDQK